MVKKHEVNVDAYTCIHQEFDRALGKLSEPCGGVTIETYPNGWLCDYHQASVNKVNQVPKEKQSE